MEENSKIELTFAPANEKQRLFMKSKKRFILLSGSVGAGKTLLGCHKGFMLNLLYPGSRGLICRKEATSIESSTLVTLLEKVIPKEMIIRHDKQKHIIIHKTLVPGVNSTIVYHGLDKGANQEYSTKIGSTEYSWIFGDEIAEFDKNDFQALSARLRYKIIPIYYHIIKKHKLSIGEEFPWSYEEYCNLQIRQFFGATNPESPDHFLYKFFFEEKSDDRLLILTTTYENPFLDIDYITALESTLTGLPRERLLHGKWVQAEGAIYDCFTYEDNTVEINLENELSSYKRFFGGADSNFPKPRAGVILGEKANGEIHVIDEYYEENSHPEDMGQWFSDWAIHFGVNIEIFHDPSDPEAIDKINNFPNIECKKALNSVIPGIDCVYKYMKQKNLKFNIKCINSIKYLKMYKWKKGAKQQPDKSTPDHIVDSLRYALFSFDNLIQSDGLDDIGGFI